MFFFLFWTSLGLSAQPSGTFTENLGQWHFDFTHSYRTDALELYVQPTGWHLYLLPPRLVEHGGHSYMTYHLPEGHETGIPEGSLYGLSFEFVGASPQVPVGLSASRAITNYFIGNDSTRWASGAQSFTTLSYCDLYPKVDMYLYRVDSQLLKYDIVVRPGGLLSDVRLRVEGAQFMRIEEHKLEVGTPYGAIVEHVPLAYQLRGSDTLSLACAYVLLGDEVGFRVDRYDPSLPLVIDPELVAARLYGSNERAIGEILSNLSIALRKHICRQVLYLLGLFYG